MKNLSKKVFLLLIVALSVIVVAGCKTTEDTAGVGEYTYNTATKVFPTNWNPHTYQTATDANILDYCSSGFYEFDYNDTKDGYQMVPAMTTEFPVDVTSQYVGQYGVQNGEEGKVYKLKLRKDLKWSTGEAITAQSFVRSAELLLNPVAQNYRADSLYSGDLTIYNALNYLYQGKHAYVNEFVSAEPRPEEYVAPADFVVSEGGVLRLPEGHKYAGEDIAVNLGKGGNWGANGFKKYGDRGYFVIDEEGNNHPSYTALLAAANEEGVVVITEETIKYVQDCIAVLQGFASVEAYAEEVGDYAYVEWEEMAYIGKTYEKMEMSEVGVFVDEDGDLCIALEKSLKGFYLLYSLSGSWLVNEKLYVENESVTEGVYANKYGTSVKTFASYGPYKLTRFESDKVYTLEKNPYWYGYNDAKNEGLFQTTKMEVKYIQEQSTTLEAFIKGEIDVYGLSANDMEDYGASEHLYYSKGASTFFVAFNPEKSGLEATQAKNPGTNKTILTIKDFRKALSLSLDRAAFCLACDPTGSVATAVFNTLIISDPDAGTPYRNSEEAKDIILAFWGLTDEVGEGKRYATKDEAIASITGVDLAQAKELFTSAYAEAKEAGLISDTDVVELTIGLPSTHPFYVNGYNFLENCWTDAVKGTPLEGRIRFVKDDTLGNGFAEALRGNQVDVLFGVGWTGSALNPYNLVNAYTLPSYQYDPAINYEEVVKDVTFPSVTDAKGEVHENVTLRASVADWSNNALQGVSIVTYVVVDGEATKEQVVINAGTQMPMGNRCRILWACEAAILEQYTLLPLDDESSAALKGQQIRYYTEEEVYGMGRGGIKYMTYNYDDHDWKAYVKSCGGKLNYK